MLNSQPMTALELIYKCHFVAAKCLSSIRMCSEFFVDDSLGHFPNSKVSVAQYETGADLST